MRGWVKRASRPSETLSAQGLIERRTAPEDTRAQALYLTRRGEERLPQIEALVREHDAAIARDFSKAEVELLKALLERIST